MNEVRGWWCPDHNEEVVEAVLNEWNQKSEHALSLCKGRDVVVQAGGNLGIFPAKLSRVFKKVVTFEPFVKNIKCFKHNITLRGIDNIDLYEAALAEEESGLGLVLTPKENYAATQVGGEGHIPGIPLDSLELPACDLLWLDIEGYEWKAIQGALWTIEKYKPVIILENKGLIPEFPGGLNGNEDLRKEIEALGYTYESRMMRDDFFIPNN